jgi:hypothetical protein
MNQQKKIGRNDIIPSFFPTLMNMAIFGHFLQYRTKG